MVAERPSEAVDSRILEEFKGKPDAPFEVIQKGETPVKYPLSLLRKLKNNWSQACELMNWNTGTEKADWHFFEVAKDPLQVVKTLQEKILEKGGTLPKYGVDRKFGSETEAALRQVVEPSTIRSPEEKEEKRSVDTDEKELEMVMKDKLREMKTLMPKVMSRIEAAGLKLPKGKDLLDETQILSYESRAKAFRENLVEEEPVLAPLAALLEECLPKIIDEIGKIDFSQALTAEGLRKLEESFSARMETVLSPYKERFKSKEVIRAMKEAKTESLLTLFMSGVAEVLAVFLNHIGNDEELKGKLEKLLSPLQEVIGTRGSEQTDIERSPNHSDLVQLPYGREPAFINKNTLTILVGDKLAHLELPYGATLTTVEVSPTGDLHLVGTLGSITRETTLSKEQLSHYLDRVCQGTEHVIELGDVAQVVLD